jgi:hypothetical protein
MVCGLWPPHVHTIHSIGSCVERLPHNLFKRLITCVAPAAFNTGGHTRFLLWRPLRMAGEQAIHETKLVHQHCAEAKADRARNPRQ